MYIFNMDTSSWYAPKEMHNGNFPYYNNPYQYNKNMVSYMDPGNCHNSNPYNNVTSNNISVPENGPIAIGNKSEFEKDTEDSKLGPEKKVPKVPHQKKQKKCVKREKGDIVNSKNDPIQDLKPSPCRGQPKHSECDKISDQDRYLIYKEFQELNNSQSKWQFIASHVYVHAKNKSTSKGPSRRENTHHYYLTVAGHKVKVCRKFFLANLNISEAVIRTSLEKLSPQGICQDDNRGRKPPPNKLSADDEEFLRRHILSFPPIEASHCKGKTPKKYLDSSLSISSMHKMFMNVCTDHDRKPVSVETYRRICKEYNISFLKTHKDPSKKMFPPQQWPKEQIESREEPQLPYKPNEPNIDLNVPIAQKQNPSTNFSFTSYLLGVEAAREFNERANSFFPQIEKTILPVEPQSSYCPDFQVENNQNNTVIEIGVMSKSNENLSTLETKSPRKNSPLRDENARRSNSKLKRLRGESYVDSKGVVRPSRPMKVAPCRAKYKHSKCDQVSDEDRALIYREFRNLRSSQAQWQFIASHVYVQAKHKSTSKGPSRRENTHQYYLTVGGHKIKVCRKFFLATLNVSEAMIRTSLEKLSPQGICQDDNRGRKPPPNKLSACDEEFLRRHILSFRSVDSSFYGKKNSKKYLDSNLSFAMMHKMFVNLCKEHNRKYVSVETYRRICKEYNIAFVKPQRDQQKKCLSNPPWCSERSPNKEDLIPIYKDNEQMVIHRDPPLTYVPKQNPLEAASIDFDLHSLLYMPEGP